MGLTDGAGAVGAVTGIAFRGSAGSIGRASANLAVHFRCSQIRNRPLVEAEFLNLLFHCVFGFRICFE